MLFLFIILQPLTRLIFFKWVITGLQQLLSKFLHLDMRFWLFSIVFGKFLLTLSKIFSKLEIKIVVLNFGEAFPLLPWIGTILIFLNLG